MPVNGSPFYTLLGKSIEKSTHETSMLLLYALKWLFLSLIIGLLAGTASAFFLISLDKITNWREGHNWIIVLLPLGGFLIGLLYYYLGKEVLKGNNQLIEEIQNPKKIIPLRMAPLVYVATIGTHLFGGSAGREGTAAQMAGALADQLTKLFQLKSRDRKIIIICGISAGFASVFGTPLAGAVFALELFVIGNILYGAILPSFLSAIIADAVCSAWGATHTAYVIDDVPALNVLPFVLAIGVGVVFGLTARFFSTLNQKVSGIFNAKISYPPLRPAVGGAILLALISLIGNTRYLGLGIPVIVESFSQSQMWYVFLIKIGLTVITLGSGFKGGEVTPLFFIGATLGSALSFICPLPVALLAGMGFTAVFAGAANTPIACVLLGIEVFGAESAVYIALACVVSYLFSGHTGIYQSQVLGHSKHLLFARHQGRSLAVINDRQKF